VLVQGLVRAREDFPAEQLAEYHAILEATVAARADLQVRHAVKDEALEREGVLSGQPRGVRLEYRVMAMNRAGIGHPSPVVSVVL